MIALLTAILQFGFHAIDPSWSCALSHRDPGVAGTYYLYCSQLGTDGVELVDVGRFISDTKAAQAAP